MKTTFNGREELLSDIFHTTKRAMSRRLAGKIAMAVQDESFVDSLIRRAKREGFGEDAEAMELYAQSNWTWKEARAEVQS